MSPVTSLKSALLAASFAAATVSAAVLAPRGPHGDIKSPMFVAVAVSENDTFHGHVLGQYHPSMPDMSDTIADLWGAPGGEVMDWDFQYLSGPDEQSLAFFWNRVPAKALYTDAENRPLRVNDTATADAEKLIAGLRVGKDDFIEPADEAFTFTACIEIDDRWNLPWYFVSYLANKETSKIADNCAPVRFKTTMWDQAPPEMDMRLQVVF